MRKPLFVFVFALLAGVLASAASAQITFTTTLRGSAEVPGPGDPDGSGFAVVTISGTTINYSLLVNGVTNPTAAHIHSGFFGTEGGIVVDLAPTFGAGCATGSVPGVSTMLVDQILADPSAFYVNVHSSEFPNGAIRGQLGNASPQIASRTFFVPVVGKLTGARNEEFIRMSGSSTARHPPRR